MEPIPEDNERTQLVEVSLTEIFYPFRSLDVDSLRDNFQSRPFRIKDIGTAVFRASSNIPTVMGDEARLKDGFYVWCEVALDSNLTQAELRNYRNNLDLVIGEREKESSAGLPEVGENEDRLKFNRFSEKANPYDWRPLILKPNQLRILSVKFTDIGTRIFQDKIKQGKLNI